jgi:hypothetical protein
LTPTINEIRAAVRTISGERSRRSPKFEFTTKKNIKSETLAANETIRAHINQSKAAAANPAQRLIL